MSYVTKQTESNSLPPVKLKSEQEGWTEAETHLLRHMFPSTRNRLIATRLQKKQSSICRMGRLLGLKKDPRFLAVASRQHQLPSAALPSFAGCADSQPATVQTS